MAEQNFIEIRVVKGDLRIRTNMTGGDALLVLNRAVAYVGQETPLPEDREVSVFRVL